VAASRAACLFYSEQMKKRRTADYREIIESLVFKTVCESGPMTSTLSSTQTENTPSLLRSNSQQAVGGRPPRYAPAPLFPPWAPKRLAWPSRRQRSSSFSRPTRSHAHGCSCLTRQHGGE